MLADASCGTAQADNDQIASRAMCLQVQFCNASWIPAENVLQLALPDCI